MIGTLSFLRKRFFLIDEKYEHYICRLIFINLTNELLVRLRTVNSKFGLYQNFIYICKVIIMRIIGKKTILKIQKKNIGNRKLCAEIDKLINDLEKFNPGEENINDIRNDADCVHSDGFYFFDINIHRTLILIEFDDDGEATILWAGTHQEYEATFKNNKLTIEKWLRKNGYIE